MKKLLFIIALFFICSCAEKNNKVENEKLKSELSKYETFEATEAATKKFMKDYISAVNSPDWKIKTLKYLRPDPEDFLKAHTAFRESFPDYKATIKHLTVDGNEGTVWINVTATYAAQFSFDSVDDSYGDNLLNGIKAENQALSWDETWHFNVENGKFAEKFDFLKDNYAVLNGLKAVSK